MNNSLDLLLSELEHFISSDDYEPALSLMKTWLDDLAVDHRLHGRVFASYALDQVCLKIGKKLLKSAAILPHESVPASKCSTVFVTSELHPTGGHTKLLADYIKALENKNIIVIVTDPDNTVNRRPIAEHFENLGVELQFSPNFESLLNKLNWLLQTLAALKPKECYLLNHANDPVAIAGMQPELVPNISFIHHCDHTLTLGIHLPHAIHIDFRLQGFNNCRNNVGITNNLVVPLVAPDLGCPTISGRFLNQETLHTCTSGGYKFEIPYAFDLTTELPKWLKITNGLHTHIGILSTPTIQTLRAKLSDLEIAQDKFRIIPYTESLWSTLLAEKIDLYIDSFPLSGTRSLVEAMGAGIAVVTHHNYATAMWSNINFVYPEAFIWQEPSELENFLATLDTTALERQSQFARDHYLKHHHPVQLRTLLTQTQTLVNLKPDHELKNFYRTDALRAFMDQFAPIPFRPQQRKEVLSQFLAFLRATDADALGSTSYLTDYLSPGDYNLFKDLITEIEATSNVIKNLNSVYSILTDKGTIDRERFTKLLYKTATANGSHKAAPLLISPKIRAKLLYRRLKTKYINLTQQNN